jgi:hypothetical protein
MRYRLRTLLFVLALAPPVLAGCWWFVGRLIADGTLGEAGAVFVASVVFGLVAMFVLIAIAKLLDAIDRAHRS